LGRRAASAKHHRTGRRVYLQIRMIDDSWDLPAHVQGTISITVGGSTSSFDIVGNDNTMVFALIENTALRALFASMNNTLSMAVVVGKARRVVSLIGSTKVTTAFLTCMGLQGGRSGNNPFE
jgi:hypothetical protein